MGTEFHLYDNGKNRKEAINIKDERKILLTCIYEQNIFGTKGPRKLRVIRKDQNGSPDFEWRYDEKKQSILDSYRQNHEHLFIYKNKPPVWNDYY